MSKKVSNPPAPRIGLKPVAPPAPPEPPNEYLPPYNIHVGDVLLHLNRIGFFSNIYCIKKDELAAAINGLIGEGRIRL